MATSRGLGKKRKKLVSQAKACKILKDRSADEFDTEKQKHFMQMRCAGKVPKKGA